MSDKEEPQVKPEEDIEKPLDAAKNILLSRNDYRDIEDHKECEKYFIDVQKIVFEAFKKENPNPKPWYKEGKRGR